jgi:hypothetical protein
VLFAERPALRVALLENRLVIGRERRRGDSATDSAEVLELTPALDQVPAWQPALVALGGWLRERQLKRAKLQVFLGGQLVRWQLLEWQPQLASPQELKAYVQLRFRATFGAAADGWRVVHAEPVPGRSLPACAIDEALLAELKNLQDTVDATLVSVVPHFSAAFDRWRGSVGESMAWFGVAEPGVLTLGLLHSGVWQGLRSVRHAGSTDWRAVLSALQAQMQLASGVDVAEQPAPLYLVDCNAELQDSSDPRLVWLSPQSGGRPGIERMAWGV